ncbi:hypothetical protein M595_5199 [Lyngbya aestuarii BL J]|uniref:Uncharacterized protein n=1 Tax=Lyngbya aestuarii BL J TaxID=1348334 RepID=U7QAN2_9CYAN|nr:hypothetical protein M595_5199 [Lyngbya aestuarii BL J]
MHRWHPLLKINTNDNLFLRQLTTQLNFFLNQVQVERF